MPAKKGKVECIAGCGKPYESVKCLLTDVDHHYVKCPKQRAWITEKRESQTVFAATRNPKADRGIKTVESGLLVKTINKARSIGKKLSPTRVAAWYNDISHRWADKRIMKTCLHALTRRVTQVGASISGTPTISAIFHKFDGNPKDSMLPADFLKQEDARVADVKRIIEKSSKSISKMQDMLLPQADMQKLFKVVMMVHDDPLFQKYRMDDVTNRTSKLYEVLSNFGSRVYEDHEYTKLIGVWVAIYDQLDPLARDLQEYYKKVLEEIRGGKIPPVTALNPSLLISQIDHAIDNIRKEDDIRRPPVVSAGKLVKLGWWFAKILFVVLRSAVLLTSSMFQVIASTVYTGSYFAYTTQLMTVQKALNHLSNHGWLINGTDTIFNTLGIQQGREWVHSYMPPAQNMIGDIAKYHITGNTTANDIVATMVDYTANVVNVTRFHAYFSVGALGAFQTNVVTRASMYIANTLEDPDAGVAAKAIMNFVSGLILANVFALVTWKAIKTGVGLLGSKKENPHSIQVLMKQRENLSLDTQATLNVVKRELDREYRQGLDVRPVQPLSREYLAALDYQASSVEDVSTDEDSSEDDDGELQRPSRNALFSGSPAADFALNHPRTEKTPKRWGNSSTRKPKYAVPLHSTSRDW
jgi:hypothetical protein